MLTEPLKMNDEISIEVINNVIHVKVNKNIVLKTTDMSLANKTIERLEKIKKIVTK